MLETTLRGYACLTKGDCICLHYNNKRYYIDIIEAKPEVAFAPRMRPGLFAHVQHPQRIACMRGRRLVPPRFHGQL